MTPKLVWHTGKILAFIFLLAFTVQVGWLLLSTYANLLSEADVAILLLLSCIGMAIIAASMACLDLLAIARRKTGGDDASSLIAMISAK